MRSGLRPKDVISAVKRDFEETVRYSSRRSEMDVEVVRWRKASLIVHKTVYKQSH